MNGNRARTFRFWHGSRPPPPLALALTGVGLRRTCPEKGPPVSDPSVNLVDDHEGAHRMTIPTPPTGAQAWDTTQRDQILQAEVAKAVRQGYTVQSITGGQAVLSKTKRMGLVLNLLLTIITGGIWLIWVIYRALNRKQQTLIINVDATGRVTRS